VVLILFEELVLVLPTKLQVPLFLPDFQKTWLGGIIAGLSQRSAPQAFLRDRTSTPIAS
jgi:hypothetical protein